MVTKAMSRQVRTGAEPTPVVKRLHKVLIANRGEVAVRLIKACRELGIATVAVYSDADRHAAHVLEADEAFHLGGSRAVESYLHIPRMVEAIRITQADGVHPGFGFLAENAAFAEAVTQCGAEFIGPSAEAIRLMGSKTRARQLARKLGIPVVPGEDAIEQSPESFAAAAERVGYPVMLKAVAGGGGMGIRVVRRAQDLSADIASARQEAASAFGEASLLIERYFERVRHIEVQVVADRYGNAVHCFDRECSIQRRRQKVIEEAPAPRLESRLRQRLADAALSITRAVGYSSLGTVEFLVDEHSGEFYFLEMNTRLQVEHTVTEMITGIDLVKWQIEIAEGVPLGRSQEQITFHGHAIECRLYAEDPQDSFAPAAGTVLHWSVESAPFTRVDTSMCTGAEVSAYYDPMLAKLIAWGRDRGSACRNVTHLLDKTDVLGLPTNQRFLSRVLRHSVFHECQTSTRYIELHEAFLTAPLDSAALTRTLIVAALQRWRTQRDLAGLDNRKRTYRAHAEQLTATITIECRAGDRYVAGIGNDIFELDLLKEDDAWLTVAIDGHAMRHSVVSNAEVTWVSAPAVGSVRVEFQSRFSPRDATDLTGSYRAAMTGRILEVLVQRGSRVRSGDRLLTMESMKMEHTTVSATDGVVSELWVTPGTVVEKGSLLIEIDDSSAGGDTLIRGRA